MWVVRLLIAVLWTFAILTVCWLPRRVLHEAEGESSFFEIPNLDKLIQLLLEEKRTNPTNLSGTEVEGGTSQRIAKGDYAFIPENTPHSFRKTEGRLVIMSIHVPRGGK